MVPLCYCHFLNHIHRTTGCGIQLDWMTDEEPYTEHAAETHSCTCSNCNCQIGLNSFLWCELFCHVCEWMFSQGKKRYAAKCKVRIHKENDWKLAEYWLTTFSQWLPVNHYVELISLRILRYDSVCRWTKVHWGWGFFKTLVVKIKHKLQFLEMKYGHFIPLHKLTDLLEQMNWKKWKALVKKCVRGEWMKKRKADWQGV